MERPLIDTIMLMSDIIIAICVVLASLYFARGAYVYAAADGNRPRRDYGRRIMLSAIGGAFAVVAARVFLELYLVGGWEESLS